MYFPKNVLPVKQATAPYALLAFKNQPILKHPYVLNAGIPIKKTSSKVCHQCLKTPLTYIDAIRSVAFFDDGPLQLAIHKFKYHNLQILKDDFTPFLAACYDEHQFNTEAIIPVPLHVSRQKKRGYNQSTLLAQSLAKRLNQPTLTHNLIRNRPTKTQTELNMVERKKNVTDAFTYIKNSQLSKRILLIDDVCTTGSTLDACAKSLKLAGIQYVYGLTIARAR